MVLTQPMTMPNSDSMINRSFLEKSPRCVFDAASCVSEVMMTGLDQGLAGRCRTHRPCERAHGHKVQQRIGRIFNYISPTMASLFRFLCLWHKYELVPPHAGRDHAGAAGWTARSPTSRYTLSPFRAALDVVSGSGTWGGSSLGPFGNPGHSSPSCLILRDAGRGGPQALPFTSVKPLLRSS